MAIQWAARPWPLCPRRGGAWRERHGGGVDVGSGRLRRHGARRAARCSPRVDRVAQLLIERGFRRNFLGDSGFAKEAQHGQFAKASSYNPGAVRHPAPVQDRVRFHPDTAHERLGASESGCVLGQPLDASGERRKGGA